MNKALKIETTALIAFLAASFMIAAIPMSIAADGWSLVYDGRSVKGYPDLREYVWQKIPVAPPHGTYDRIGLHRLVKTGITPKGVVFMNHYPGFTPEQLMNWPEANWTRYENSSQAIYWANRGFDVYTVDYRNGFVPPTLNASQLLFMADWGMDIFMSDLREAILKTKEVSGAQKIFIADTGLSYGAMNYAVKYGKEDLRGIIMLGIDTSNLGSAPIGARIGNQTNTYNATKLMSDANSKGNWSDESAGWYNYLYAANNPGAPNINPLTGQSMGPPLNPVTNKTWTNITEFQATALYMAYGPGGLTNIYGGYADPTTIVQFYAGRDRYRPWTDQIERRAMWDWINCPYIAYDYDDHWSEISVPMLVFASELLDNRTGQLRLTNGISTTDFTGIYLKNYGWLDVYCGTYSARDVSEPSLQWMLGQMAGLKATAFCNVTVMPGWTWNFFTHSTGGTGSHTYQWYEGATMLQGQTSMVLPVTKTTRGTYTFYCKVTDSEGATAYSNPVTLAVLG